MKKMLHAMLLGMSLLASAAAQAAAGRVLIAAGDVVALRDGRSIALSDGAQVESGDTIQVGERSSVQLLMADKAVLALRANTSLALSTYRFDDKGSQSFLTLLRGGLRAVTGLIGKRNNANFKLTTPTSTIGIRGTHFTVVQCNGNCLNSDGSKAADGLFGGVTDGRIVVANGAGEKEFRRNEYFYVANRDTQIRTLPEPPPFLRDPQDARGRASTSATAAAEAKAAAPKQDETAQAAASSAPPAAAAATDAVASASAAATVAVTPTTVTTAAPVNNAPVVQGVAFSVSEAFTNGVSTIGQQNTGFGQPPYVFTSRAVPVLSYRTDAAVWDATNTSEYSNPDGSTTMETVASHYTKTASVGVGSAPAAGNVFWGQYVLTEDGQYTAGPNTGQTYTVSRARHWAIGDGVEQLPTSGSYTYNWVGGTTPTDVTGAVPRAGTLTSGGSIGVRFDNQTMSTITPIQWSMPSSGSSYTVNFQNVVWTPAVTTATDPVDGTTNRNTTYPTVTASASTCTGCSNLTVSVSPTFFGKTAQGLGLAISTRATVGTATERTATTQVYQRP